MTTPKSIDHKVFTVFGIPVHCHTLDNGRRIVAADDITKLLDLMAVGFSDADVEASDLDCFVLWCRQK
jgi:hypothetical protein